jgi:ribose transport system ATP-binding protein
MASDPIIEIRNIHKTFGPTIALGSIDLSIRRGEVRGLIGENGSGKSTVMSIAAGMQSATSGEMFYKGKPWNPSSMLEAQKSGISMILQESNTIPHVSVAQNIFAGRENEFARGGMILMKKMYKAADQLLSDFGITHMKGADPIDVHNFEDRKLIEIVRCVSDYTEVLIVDETTTALSHEGRDILYKLIRRLAGEGKAVVFISHDMDEILTRCDVLTVLRDGDIIGHLTKEDMTKPNAVSVIRNMMVGREIGEKYYREDYVATHSEEVALALDHISFGLIRDFHLTLYAGEIVGLGGLSGCGMHEIGRAAYGLEELETGAVLRNGKEIRSCLQAIESGIGYISKNRDTEALITEASIQENITLPSLSALEKRMFINPADERKMSDEQIASLRIKCGDGEQSVKTLSGGNKQKVSFAKWTAKGSDVIVMDCPTRGVDIGVKQAMYALIEQMKRDGKAILMISEELPELIGMSDRIVIMKDFVVTKEFVRSQGLRETDIIEYMI